LSPLKSCGKLRAKGLAGIAVWLLGRLTRSSDKKPLVIHLAAAYYLYSGQGKTSVGAPKKTILGFMAPDRFMGDRTLRRSALSSVRLGRLVNSSNGS